MMLKTLHIEGFKSLRSTTVELGTVNVFIGANGSGKSNILESLGVLGAALFGTVGPEALKYRGVRPGVAALYKSSFSEVRIPRIISLEAKSETARYRVGLDNPISGELSAWGIQSETLEDSDTTLLSRSPRGCNANVGSRPKRKEIKLSPPRSESAVRTVLQQVEDAEGARSLVSNLTNFAIYSPNTDVLRGLAEDVTRDPLGLSGSGLPRALQELTDRSQRRIGFIDFDDLWDLINWADSVGTVPTDQAHVSPAVNVGRVVLRFRDRFMARGRNTLSAYDASEGALYVLFLLVLASHPRSPRLFAIDNFDHALHPRLAARLMRLVVDGLVEDGTRQMLLTTHNPLVLDGLNLRDDRVRLFAVERATSQEQDAGGRPCITGETLVHRVILSEDLLQEVDAGFSLSRLWVMGRLGGIPRDI